MSSLRRRILRTVTAGLFALLGTAAGLATPVPLVEATSPGRAQASRPLVVEVMLHDTLQAVSADSFRTTMQAANRLKPVAIIVNLSTPGGLAESASAIASVIDHSRAPVIVYMREPGTHVSGEGLRVLQSGDVRAMGSQTALVPALARTSTRPAAVAREQASLLQALGAEATRHSRPLNGIRGLLDNRDTIGPAEALRAGAIDMVAPTEDKLLASLNGVTVRRANGTTVTLQLTDGFVTLLPMTLREHMMRALMNPDLTVLLLALGGLLLYLEVNTPGGVVPGAAGLLLVLLAMYALYHMPLRWEGLLLLTAAGLLLLAEAHFQRGMVFALLAMFTLVVGLRLLVKAPIAELEVNWGTAIGAGIGFGGVTAGLLLLGLKARRYKVRTGAEAMLGWFAVTQTPLAPEGEILVRGELWRARLSGTDAYLAAGEAVKVERALGAILLEVAPLPNLQSH